MLNDPSSIYSGPPPRAEAAHRALERYSWLISLAATGFAGFLIWRFNVTIEGQSLIVSLGVMAFLIAICTVYRRWRPSPVLSNLSGAIAVLYCSIGMAGTISLIGLQYKSSLIDERLATVDRSLGIDLPSTIGWFADHPVSSQLLDVAYRSSFFQLFGLVIALAVVRRFDKLWQLVFVCSLTIVASTTFSVFWPAKGAFAYFDYPSDLLERLPVDAGTYHLAKFEYFRNVPSPVISFANLQGVVTFPSFHCCLVLMTIFAVTGTGWIFGSVLIWNLLVLVSTLPIGGHYVIDLPCGALLWLAATIMSLMLGRRAQTASVQLSEKASAEVEKGLPSRSRGQDFPLASTPLRTRRVPSAGISTVQTP